jgi:eukaryotic-like serine/threonine-protein kinase
MSTTTSPPPLPPAVLAQRYRLERRLAQGGMAEVWLGTDLSLSRQVAVKLLKPTLASDPVVAERFRREAISVAQLNHPNIVAVYDAIEDNGRQAVVMQLVNGKSLRQLLDEQKKLSPDLTIHIGSCVASALDAAHQAGMVHRDVKPGNILITPDGRVLLTDFGIAKGLESAGDDLTNDNIMMGTAKYLSPEQVRGKRLDGRADLYSLGLVLYECLAGRVPFLGQNDADTALARLQRDPTDITRLRPTLPPGLADLIHRLLARRPDQRYASGAAVRVALTEVAARANDPIPGDSTGTGPVLFDPTRRPTGSTPVQARQPAAVGGYQPVRTTSGPSRSDTRDRTPTGQSRVQKRPNREFEQRRGPSMIVVGLLLLMAVVVSAALWTTLGTGDRGAAGETATTEPITTTPPITQPVVIDPAAGIVAAVAYDPDGDDGQENNGQVPLILDGNPSTGWTTSCYSSEYLGGKGGVGVVATLGTVASGRLTVQIASAPWILEVYGTQSDAIPVDFADWGPPLASDNATSAETFTLQVTTPVRHLLVSLRQLGPGASCSSDNPYSGTLAEVQFEPIS